LIRVAHTPVDSDAKAIPPWYVCVVRVGNRVATVLPPMKATAAEAQNLAKKAADRLR
jgi:hypothetical protein